MKYRHIYLGLVSLFMWIFLFCMLVIAVMLAQRPAGAHGYSADPKVREWFEGLMQPDSPQLSCCGEADAYWADDFSQTPEGYYVAIITDTRDDTVPCEACDGGTRQRRHIEPGTRIIVPNSKIKWDKGNPTGHGIVFMPQYASWQDEDGNPVQPVPYCYLPPLGT